MRIALVLPVLVLVLAGCGRPNPRLKSVTGTGPFAGTTTFTYDSDRHPTLVEDDGSSTTLTWDGPRLASAFDGRKLDFEYDGDRLRSASIDAEQLPVEYDDLGRLTTLDDNTFTYGDGLESVTSSSSEQTTTFVWEGGLLTRARGLVAGSGEIAVSFTYEGGRVVESEVQGTTTTFTYGDDGLLSRLDQTGGAERVFEYEEGDVADIEITPSGTFFPFTPLWDLRGAPHRDLDLRTQTTRLAGIDW